METHNNPTEKEPSPEAIKPSIIGQAWAISKNFFSMKKRHYVRSFIEIVCPLFVITIGMYALIEHYPSPNKNTPDILKQMGWKMSPKVMLAVLWAYFYFSIAWLVTEKHDGFRLLMHTMGLKKVSFYLGVSCSLLTISLPISLIIGYILRALISSDGTVPFGIYPLFFVIYPLQVTSIILAIGSLINSPNLVSLAIMAPFLDYVNNFLYQSICNHVNENLIFIPIIIAHISPQTAMIQMIQKAKLFTDPPDEMPCKNYHYPPLEITLLLMTFWSLIMFSFAWYFDSICPWQTLKSPEPLLYCLKQKAQRLWHPYEEQNSKVPDPFVNYDKNYFEPAPHNKPLGIYADEVTKRFSSSGIVVSSLSFSVYKGQTTLLLGHNGAGKTTLMNMILGNLAPSQGRLYINGYDADTCSEDARIGVGLCPQQSIAMDDLTVDEHLDLFASIKCNYTGDLKHRHIDSVLRSVGLLEHRQKLCKELSGGMKRKLSLALAFVGDSNVLILDEPSSGVDPESRKFIWDSIRKYRSTRTVLLSTQHMEEADYLGDRIAIMSAGKIACCGSSVFLKKAFGSAYRLRLECKKESLGTVISRVKRHFSKAKLDSNDQSHTNQNQQFVDTTIELIPDGDNTDDQLIHLFEDLEQNYSSLGIKSFGLKCSTIEDVLLNSAEAFSGNSVQSRENVALELETLSNKVALVGHRINFPSSCSRILSAFIVKHCLEAYRDLWATLFWRFILATIVLCSMSMSLSRLANCDSPGRGFSFFLLTTVMTSFIRNPLTERQSKFKLMQLCSKATQLEYWLSRLVVDLSYIVLYSLILIAFCQYTFTSDETNHFGGRYELYSFIFMLMLALSLASLLMTYILSTCVTDLSNGVSILVALLNIHKVIWVLVTILSVTQILKPMNMKEEIISNYFYYIIPTVTAEMTVMDGFIKNTFLANCHQEMPPNHLYSWSSSVWLGIIVLSLQSVLFAVILAVVETKRMNIISLFDPRSYFIDKRPSGMDLLDDDVVNEEIRARGIMENYSGIANSALVAKELTKSYTSKNRAVDGLTFAVGKPECFGLLGPNGAGKSTTFSMLTGDIFADHGRVVCNRLCPDNDIEAYCESIGYDPQSNAEMKLSPVEALYFMARLRGVEESRIHSIVDAFLDLLSMQEHRNKSATSLSGGTKRKLSLAMALIGSPPVLMLDEPTAGIDPMSRHDIWLLLNTLKRKHGSSIIISSHAMEECEAICDRLTIMIRGRMRCLGSFQHLRSKFGQGYIVRVQFDANENRVEGDNTNTNQEQIAAVSDYLSRSLRNSLIIDDVSTNSVVFKVTDGLIPRSLIFKSLKELKYIHANINYLVGDSTLEDIFVSLAREQREPKNHVRHLTT